VSVLRAGPLFWFLLACAVASGWFFVLAVNDRDRSLAWSAAIVFVLLCVAAASELLLWGSP
jgi:hypothetical protein